MPVTTLRLLALALALALALVSLGCRSKVWVETGEHDQLAVYDDGEPFACVVTSGAQFPYVYPLFAPGGTPVTRGFPMDPRPGEAHDHPHHRSFWLTHGDVNGYDFWHPGERFGEIVTVDCRFSNKGGAARVELDLHWVADEKVLLTERRVLTFHSAGGVRWIDVDSELRAQDEAVVFGDTKEGSFALRLHPTLRLEGDVAAGSARNSEGVTGKEIWGKRARWVHYSGPSVGVAIFDHPSNPRHPTWWHARTYGLVAANPFGVHDFEGAPAHTGDLTLRPDEFLTLRYRVLLHAGTRTPEQLDADFEGW